MSVTIITLHSALIIYWREESSDFTLLELLGLLSGFIFPLAHQPVCNSDSTVFMLCIAADWRGNVLYVMNLQREPESLISIEFSQWLNCLQTRRYTHTLACVARELTNVQWSVLAVWGKLTVVRVKAWSHIPEVKLAKVTQNNTPGLNQSGCKSLVYCSSKYLNTALMQWPWVNTRTFFSWALHLASLV